MNKIKSIFLYAISLNIILTFQIRSQSIQELSFYAPLISTFELKYINNHLLISQQGLKVFDVTDLFNPQFITQVSYPGNIAYQLEVQNNRAYMAKGGGGVFAVYDISNINAPVLAGSVSIPSTEFLLFGDLKANGNYVYMAGYDTIFVIDVTIASLPLVVNKVVIPDAGFNGGGDIVINDNTLYVQAANSVRVFNITNSITPLLINSIAGLHPNHRGLEVDSVNNKLFFPWKSALQDYMGHDTYDISNPLNSVYLFSDSIPSSSGEYGITAYYRNILYLSQGGRIKAFDVSSIGHSYLTEFTGQNVANSTVSIEIKDSVFFNGKRGGFEVLRYVGPFPTSISNSNTNLQGNNVVKIFSNHALKQIIISGNAGYNAQIDIYNILGQKLYQESNVDLSNGQSKIISFNNFTSGIYFTIIRGNSKVFTQKFVVQ